MIENNDENKNKPRCDCIRRFWQTIINNIIFNIDNMQEFER